MGDLSEKKEKLKILANEVEILRMESASKDRNLVATKNKAAKKVVERDQLRTDFTKANLRGEGLNEQVEQFVIEIDKLNSVINTLEREMVVLKRDYEKAVEDRNHTGIQLIDRNDELCILWEKHNIQEQVLTKGELELQSREEDIRRLNLERIELAREKEVVRKFLPLGPELEADAET